MISLVLAVHLLFYAVHMRLTWPLAGRGEEMRLIEAALSDPDASGVVISGSAGVGKSRIGREALVGAASRGCEVRWVVGTSCGRGFPLGALASWPGLVGDDSLQLVCGVIDSLTAASSAGPVVVGVDDPHLLDDLSMFVLDQVVQRGVAKVLLTLRDDEPIPIAIQELWKLGEFERVDLEPLSPDETTALLSAALDGSVDPHTARSLWQLTQGNILYLAAHRRAGGRRRASGRAERLLAVGRRAGRAARPGRTGRDAHGRAARRGRRCRRCAGDR